MESEKNKKTLEDSTPLVWKLFGGTVVSVIVLLLITVINTLNGNIDDIRTTSAQSYSSIKVELIELRERIISIENSRSLAATKISELEAAISTLRDEKIASLEQSREGLKEKIASLEQELTKLRQDYRELLKSLQEVREKIATIKPES